MGAKFVEMGGDIDTFEGMSRDLIGNAAATGAEAQDILGPLFNLLAERQEKASTRSDDMLEQLEGKVDPEVLAKVKTLEGEEREKFLERAQAAAGVGDLDTFANERNQSYKDLAEAKEALKTVKDKQTKLTEEATKRGSIFTHDIYLERILLNILTVLEGQGRSVDLLPANLNPLASAATVGKAAAPSFMKKFGGNSLTDFANMGDEEKQKMLSMLSKDSSISSSGEFLFFKIKPVYLLYSS